VLGNAPLEGGMRRTGGRFTCGFDMEDNPVHALQVLLLEEQGLRQPHESRRAA